MSGNRRNPFDFRRGGSAVGTIFGDSAAGLQVSGDSGSGKSNFTDVLLRKIIAEGFPVFVLDPHGSLVESLRDYVLSLPERFRRRLYWIEPGNTNIVTSINPLAVPTEGLDEFSWRARVVNKCGHTSRIILAATGEDDLLGKPRLAKWMSRLVGTLAVAGLSLADALMFLDPGNPVYRSLIRAVPDLMARHEFEELEEMRPTDRENLIESTKNRFVSLFQNPIVEATLGRTTGAIDVGRLYDESAICLVNLAPQGVLRDEDQSILANLWLSEILHVVFNRPAARRRPTIVAIDELPVFRACAPLLNQALTQVRKFLARFLCCHQGSNNFADRGDDRLLHNLVSQCRVHVYFRHANPLDAKFFGEIVTLPALDPLKVKHEQRQTQQFQDGHDIVMLEGHGESQSNSDATGGGGRAQVSLKSQE